MAKKKKTINVQGAEITLLAGKKDDYISITDIARKINSRTDIVITNWLRNRNTVEFLGVWEQLHNPDFNPIEFDGIRNQTGLNTFILTAKQWIQKTHAIGIQSKAGRYGGTFAHKDIAFEFCSYVSPVFKLYLLKEFQRLKEQEAKQERDGITWNIKRTLAKVNYHIHTDAVQQHLIPPKLTKKKQGIVYASEADLLNVALFGMTAKEWRIINPKKKGNMRDFATGEQLIVLANLESLNAEFIKIGLDQEKRMERLNEIAIHQMKVLMKALIIPNSIKELPKRK